MKYTVRKSVVELIGTIWMPAVQCGQCKTLSDYDVENCRDEDGKITRESVEQWLMCHSGDFQSVTDFYASIEDGENTIEIPWNSEESEMAYWQMMDPEPA